MKKSIRELLALCELAIAELEFANDEVGSGDYLIKNLIKKLKSAIKRVEESAE